MTYSAGPGVGESTVFEWAGSPIGNVVSIEPPELDRAMISKTCLGDPVKTTRPSLIPEVKGATLKLRYNNPAHNVLVTAQSAGAPSTAKFIYYDAVGAVLESWTFSQAYVKSVKVTGADVDKNIEADVAIEFEVLPVISSSGS